MKPKASNYISDIKYEYKQYENIQKDSILYVSSIDIPLIPILYLDKISGKKYAKPGEVIDYTIVVENRGNVELEQLSIYDNLPKEVNYIDKSMLITVNGKEIKFNEDYIINMDNTLRSIYIVINKKIYIDDIILITYNVKIDKYISSKVLKNEIRIGYIYNDMNSQSDKVIINAKEKEIEDNYALTYIEYASLTISKVIDKNPVNIGDILSYKIELKNSGNLDAVNVKIEEYILDEMNYASIKGEIQNPGEEKLEFKPRAILVENNLLIITEVKVPHGEYILSNSGTLNYENGKTILTISGMYKGGD